MSLFFNKSTALTGKARSSGRTENWRSVFRIDSQNLKSSAIFPQTYKLRLAYRFVEKLLLATLVLR